ncbi:MAG: hypothetical protein RBU45_23460 [Myxococcota bacterium]|jgi:hypothetical protein|nr:hypothetical protein [Myxococcota bacterium]
MLESYIIDWLRRERQRRDGPHQEERPRLELPDQPPLDERRQTDPSLPGDDGGEGVVIFEL